MMGQCVSQEPFLHRQAIMAPACNTSVSDTSRDNHSHAEFRLEIASYFYSPKYSLKFWLLLIAVTQQYQNNPIWMI